ncbi:MAG: ECF-type sigma factor [Planctomycetota bacterium]
MSEFDAEDGDDGAVNEPQDNLLSGEQLLPVVYRELRLLAAQRLANESPGQTLQATALVHEAFLRVRGSDDAKRWNNAGHFYAAAAEAMRRILIENARKKKRVRHGGEWNRADILEKDLAVDVQAEEIFAIDDALNCLSSIDPQAGEIVKLRYFTGMSIEEIAQAREIPRATAYRHWKFGRAWIRRHIFSTEAGD